MIVAADATSSSCRTDRIPPIWTVFELVLEAGVANGLGTREWRVLLAVLKHADFGGGTGVAWPSVATIAGAAGYSTRHVHRALRSLEDCGLVVPTNAASNGRSLRRQVCIPGLFESPPIAATGTPDCSPEVSPPVTTVVTQTETRSELGETQEQTKTSPADELPAPSRGPAQRGGGPTIAAGLTVCDPAKQPKGNFDALPPAAFDSLDGMRRAFQASLAHGLIAGVMRNSEAAWNAFVSLALYAQAKSRRPGNPGGYFRTILEGHDRDVIAAGSSIPLGFEDAAGAWIQQHRNLRSMASGE